MHPELFGNALEPLRGAQLEVLALDHARAGDQEQGLVEPDLASKQLHDGYLGEPADNRHRSPLAKSVTGGKIVREGLATMDSATDEHSIEAHPGSTENIGQEAVTYREN